MNCLAERIKIGRNGIAEIHPRDAGGGRTLYVDGPEKRMSCWHTGTWRRNSGAEEGAELPEGSFRSVIWSRCLLPRDECSETSRIAILSGCSIPVDVRIGYFTARPGKTLMTPYYLDTNSLTSLSTLSHAKLSEKQINSIKITRFECSRQDLGDLLCSRL
jgi:hypothetical protein